jgi:hypothetical protein
MRSLSNANRKIDSVVSVIEVRSRFQLGILIALRLIELFYSAHPGPHLGYVEQISRVNVELVSNGRLGNAQRTPTGNVLDEKGPKPELVALRDCHSHKNGLRGTIAAERMRRRLMNHHLKVSSLLKVLSDSGCNGARQFTDIVKFVILPRAQVPVSYPRRVVDAAVNFQVS